MQTSRASLSDSLLKSWTNEVQITQLASSASEVPSNFKLIILIACIAGLASALTFIFAIAYFDNTSMNVKGLETVLDIPSLGNIQKTRALGLPQPTDTDLLVVKTLPLPVTENGSLLMAVKVVNRLNSFNSTIGLNKPIMHESALSEPSMPQTILVSGLYSEDNAIAVAVNLAVALAQTGNKVLLVDSNLRGQVVDELFGASAVVGSSTTMTSPDSSDEVITIPSIKNLSILPINPVVSDPFGLFSAKHTHKEIDRLNKIATYILIVGAPLMSSADTFTIASHVNGIILVTPDKGLKSSQVDNFAKSSTTYNWKIIGTVLVSNKTYMRPFFKQQWGYLSDKLRSILGRKPANPEKVETFENPTNIEDLN